MKRLTRYAPALLLLAFILVQAAMLSPKAVGAIGDLWAIATVGGGTDILRVDSSGNLLPGTTGTYSLGSSSLKFQNAYMAGQIYGAEASWTNLTATGDVTMNDAGADTLLIGAAADTLTMLGNVSITDTQWSISATGVAAFAGTTATTLEATGNVTFNDAGADTLLLGAAADTVTVLGDVAITDTQWSVSAAGAAAFASITSGGNAVKAAGDEIAGINVPMNLRSLDVDSGGTVDLTRNGAMDWSLNQTSGGAETTVVSAVVPYKIDTASKGAKLTKIIVGYEIAVADATSVDVTCSSIVYAQATAPAVTANHGGAIVDGDYDTDHDTAAERADKDVTGGEHVLTLTLNTPAYYVTANGEVRFEFVAVLQNTGTLKVRYVTLVYTEKEQ